MIKCGAFCVILYIMIEKLPIYENELAYRNEPLLEYVVKVANHFWPSYDTDAVMLVDGVERNVIIREESTVPELFADRLNKGNIHIFDGSEYLHLEELQDSIKAFCLDPSKFWYLGLCIKDLVIGQTRNTYSFFPSSRKQLETLLAGIEKLIRRDNSNLEQQSYFWLDGEAELIFKVKGVKHSVKITDNSTIKIIYLAIKDILLNRSVNDPELLDSSSVDLSKTINLAQIKQVYQFSYYLSWFLNDYTVDKTIDASKKGMQISYDKRFLVSRMIYATGLVRNRKYYDNHEFLKNNLKSYKDIEFNTLNNHY